jgi:hypothetical protein
MNGRTSLQLPAEQAIPIIARTALGYIREGTPAGHAIKRAQFELGVNVPPEHARAVETQVRLFITRDLMVTTIDGYLKEGKPAREAILRTIADLGISIPEDKVETLITYYAAEIERLKTALDDGKHVAGGQVVEVVSDEQFREESSHGSGKTAT